MIRPAQEIVTVDIRDQRWWRWARAVVYMGSVVATVILACGLAGAGWDIHPFRLAAVLTLLAGPTLTLGSCRLHPTQRWLAAVAGLFLAAAGWILTPARPSGHNLYQAWRLCRYLQQQWQAPSLEALKYADHYHRTLAGLQAEYPSLTSPLAEQWQQWTDAMVALIQQRFAEIDPDDIHAARVFFLQTTPFTRHLSATRLAVDEAWQSWLSRAVAARITELNRLPPESWEQFQRNVGLRRQLARYYPQARDDLRAAEHRWINRSIDTHLQDSDQLMLSHPRAVRDVCRRLKEHLRSLRTLEDQDLFVTAALQRVFEMAQRAAVREVLHHVGTRRYLQAYSIARVHALDWLPLVQKWDPSYRRRLESIRDTTRFLAILAERLPETIPPPRPGIEEPTVAPHPRPAQPDQSD
ncbi:MAG: hypothetical protein RMJ88_04035 [Thermogemmata sp.]|nr:hypothetical protein [Thermogemmata sp.]